MKITRTLVCLFATLFATQTPVCVQAQSHTTICPAGWGHGSVAAPENFGPECYGGRADLTTFSVNADARRSEPIGRLDYAAPKNCLSETGTYVIQIEAKASDFSQTFVVNGDSGSVRFFLGKGVVAPGVQPLYVRISSGVCHAEVLGDFEIVVVNT